MTDHPKMKHTDLIEGILKEFEPLAESCMACSYNSCTAHVYNAKDRLDFLHSKLASFGNIRYEEGRQKVIKSVEDTIAEFGNQGIELVASILEEKFHSQPLEKIFPKPKKSYG